MEKDGGIMTKISSCFPENYAFSRHTFQTNDPKMCKDGLNPMFCSVPDSIVDDNAMDVQECSLKKIAHNTDKGNKPDFSFNDKTFFSLIHGKQDNDFQNAVLPTWNNNSGFSFSQNSQINNNKSVSGNSFQVLESFSTARNPNPCESASNSVLNTDSPLSFVVDDESSSSIEEIFRPRSDDFEEIHRNYASRHVVHLSNTTEKPPEESTENSSEKNKSTPESEPPISDTKHVELTTPNKDQITPELPPPLICIDDDEESCQSSIKTNYEIIDVADSPEMPILTPFSSDDEEVLKIKQEVISEDEVEKSISIEDQLLSKASGMRQPQVLLRRISLEQCLQFTPESKRSFVGVSLSEQAKNSSFDGPEIEEIEGVRFFQFRSKQEMDEFNEKPGLGIEDLDMILPTKTMDITQIKGWRDKYFASESQLHYFQLENKETDSLMSSHNCDKKENPTSDTGAMNAESSLCVTDDDGKKSSLEESKTDSKSATKSHIESKFKSQNSGNIETKDLKTQLSAFISEDLDNFLKTKSELNVNYLQKINPNIMPIPPNSGILSLGKLKQPDRPVQYQNKRFFLYKPKYSINEEDRTSPRNSDANLSSPEVITMNSSDENLSDDDDDIPVAKLNTVRRRKRRLNSMDLEKCTKRRKSDGSSDQSQRLVLRLTKESKGSSEGYKISEGYSKKSDLSTSSSSSPMPSPPPSPAPSSSSSSSDEEIPDEFKDSDASLFSVITRSIFVKNEEPKLLSEFIKNLNSLGTRKDVTMLVESNKSYFKEIPILDEIACNDALSALLSNDELIQVKLKPKSRRKLKTWQKYLPKKLTTNQKLKISKTKENILSTEKSENTVLSTKVKTSSGVRKPRKKKLDNNAIIEDNQRGKRSIRLPARYLDSAVLAAGTEWVSPIFVDDPKKNRKQLLEVLDKLKNESSKQTEAPSIESIAGKDSLATRNFSIQSSNEKPPGLKSTKPPIKANNAKRLQKPKVCNAQKLKKMQTKSLDKKVTKSKSRVAEFELSSSSSSSPDDSSSSSDDTSSSSDSTNSVEVGLVKSSFVNFPYYLPACACLPCSRTASFNHVLKELVCFNDHSFHSSGSERNPNTLFNHYTIAHDASEPVRLSIPCKGNDSSDSILQISEDIINGGFLESNRVKSDFFDEISSNDIGTESRIASEVEKRSDPNVLPADSSENKISSEVEKRFDSNVLPSDGPAEILQLKSDDSSLGNKAAPVKEILTTQTSYNKVFVTYGSPPKLKMPRPEGSNAIVQIPPINSQTGPNLKVISTAGSTSNNQPKLILPANADGKNNKIIILVPTYANSPNSNNANSASNTLPKMSGPTLKPKPSILYRKPSVSNTICNTGPQSLINQIEQSPVVMRTSASNMALRFSSQSLDTSAIGASKPAQSPQMMRYRLKDGKLYLQSETISSPPNVNSYTYSAVSNPTVDSNASKEVPNDGLLKSILLETEGLNQTESAQENNCDRVTEKTSNVSRRPTKTRRKSPLLKRKMNDSLDSDVDVETVDDKFDPRARFRLNSDDEGSSIFTPLVENSNSADKTKLLKERQRRYVLRRNFEKLKNASQFFKEAPSSKEVLDRALYAIKKYKKKELSLRMIKHRLRIHNTRLLGKFFICLQGIKDTHVRNLAKKQVIKNLAHDWVKQALVRQKIFPVTPHKKSKKASNKVPPATDLEEYLKNQSNDSAENTCAEPTQNARSSLSIDVSQMQYKVEIEPQMDFEISEEPQADFELFKDFQVSSATDSKIERTEKTSEINTYFNKAKLNVNNIVQSMVEEKGNNNIPTINKELYSSPTKEPTSIAFENKLESVPSTCPSQIFEDTPSDENSPEDGPLIIDISDDENSIPDQVPIESIKNEINDPISTKEVEGAKRKLKFNPGLESLHSDEIFEDFDDDVSPPPQNSIPEILRYLTSDLMKCASSSHSETVTNNRKSEIISKGTSYFSNTNVFQPLVSTAASTYTATSTDEIVQHVKNQESFNPAVKGNSVLNPTILNFLTSSKINSLDTHSINTSDSQQNNSSKIHSNWEPDVSQRTIDLNAGFHERDSGLNSKTASRYIPEEITIDDSDDNDVT